MTAEFVPANRLYDVRQSEPTVPYWVAVSRALTVDFEANRGERV